MFLVPNIDQNVQANEENSNWKPVYCWSRKRRQISGFCRYIFFGI